MADSICAGWSEEPHVDSKTPPDAINSIKLAEWRKRFEAVESLDKLNEVTAECRRANYMNAELVQVSAYRRRLLERHACFP